METGQIELRATTNIRNHAMLSARERLGLSQKEASERCGVPFNIYIDLEKLRYPNTYNEDYVVKIAAALGITTDSVFPLKMTGIKVINKTVKTKVVSCDKLLEYRTIQKRLFLKAPDEIVEQGEQIEIVKSLSERLKPKQKKVLQLRLGLEDGKSYSITEVAKKLKMSVESTRQFEIRAIYRIQELIKLDKAINA